MVSVVIHSNPQLKNQIETADWLRQGFARHGIEARITADKSASADVHVVQGPWYAYNEALHMRKRATVRGGWPRVLYLNRCYFGHERFDISLGWLQPDGSRDFKNKGMAAAKGKPIELKPEKKTRRGAVIFADYGKINQAEHWQIDARKKYQPTHLHLHPADQTRWEYYDKPVAAYTLDELWERCDVAIGGTSTVLIDAKINGLHVISHDPLHAVHHESSREQWAIDLTWANWNHQELTTGKFWDHLC